MFDLFKYSSSKNRHVTDSFQSLAIEDLEERLLLAADVEFFDLEQGAFGSVPDELTDINRTLFFAAFNTGTGKELWVSDGTEAGTRLLKDIHPGANNGPGDLGGSYPEDLAQVGGILLFDANDGSVGGELWASNGTTAGTILLKDIQRFPGWYNRTNTSSISGITGLGPLGGRAVFSAYTGNDARLPGSDGLGQELWISDGTSGGTFALLDVNPGFNPPMTNDMVDDWTPYNSFPADFTNVGGNVFFTADSERGPRRFTTDRELWFTDGTNNNVFNEPKGTFEVRDINPFGSSNPDNLINHNGLLYFAADDGTNGRQVWRTNGTLQGTIRVTDINPGGGGAAPKNLRSVGNEVWFSATDGTNGQELWKTSISIQSAAAEGAISVKDINPDGDSSPGQFVKIDDTVFFSAYDSTHGLEIWKSDGTDGGTVLLKDINREPGLAVGRGSDPENLIDLNGTLFFSAYTIASGVELWSTDGTTEGTTMFTDINRRTDSGAPVGAYPAYFQEIDGVLYFRANDGVTGDEFYKLGPIINGTDNNDDLLVFVDDVNGVRISVNGLLYQFGFQDGIVVDAKDGFDNVQFTGGSGDETVILQDGTLKIEGGNYEVTVTNVEVINATGGLGLDTAIFRDTPGDDRFTGRQEFSELNGAGFRLRADRFERVRVTATTGNDISFLYDSPGNDRFYAFEDRSIMTGTNYDNRTFGFDSYYGFASTGTDLAYLYDNDRKNQYSAFSTHAQLSGGNLFSRASGFDFVNAFSTTGGDRAVFHDTPGNDTYSARTNVAEMITSNGTRNRATNFERTDAHSTGGSDSAVLRDSSGDDIFYGNPENARLVGTDYANLVHGFPKVVSFATTGNDRAFLTDSSGNDRFYGRAAFSELIGSGFQNRATNFDRVTATASRGDDFAYLFDSDGDDRFYGEKRESRLIGPGFINIARKFDKTFARATNGTDFAYLRDTNGNDLFVGRTDFALMIGNDLFNKTFGFDRNFAFATGGNDRANLYDSSGDDVFFGRRNHGKLSGNGFFYKATKFDRINAYALNGGTDKINADALRYRFERFGQWENIV